MRRERRQRWGGVTVAGDTGERLRLKRDLEASFQGVIPLIARFFPLPSPPSIFYSHNFSHTHNDKIILHMRKLIKNCVHQNMFGLLIPQMLSKCP